MACRGTTVIIFAQLVVFYVYNVKVLCFSQENAPVNFHNNLSPTKFSLNSSLISHS